MQIINITSHITLTLTLNSVTNGKHFVSFNFLHKCSFCKKKIVTVKIVRYSYPSGDIWDTLEDSLYWMYSIVHTSLKLLHLLIYFLLKQEIWQKAGQKAWLNITGTHPGKAKQIQHQQLIKPAKQVAESLTRARFYPCEISHCSFAHCDLFGFQPDWQQWDYKAPCRKEGRFNRKINKPINKLSDQHTRIHVHTHWP